MDNKDNIQNTEQTSFVKNESDPAADTAKNLQSEPVVEPNFSQQVNEPKAEEAVKPPVQPIQPQPAAQTAINPVAQPVQPSKFALTAKQVWTIIKNFFSKNCVDSVAAQYNEPLPVWGIFLPAYVLLSAISATVSFNANGDFTTVFTAGLNSKITFGSGEVFFLTLALNLMTVFAMALAVRAFIKFHKGDGHFLSSANLVTVSYLPVILFYVFNILTGGALSSIVNSVSVLGTVASYMLLFSGTSKALGGKKPIWSFFLMIVIAETVAVIVAMIVISPILFSRFAFSIMDTLR